MFVETKRSILRLNVGKHFPFNTNPEVTSGDDHLPILSTPTDLARRNRARFLPLSIS